MTIRCRSGGWSETVSHCRPVRAGLGPVPVVGDPGQRPPACATTCCRACSHAPYGACQRHSHSAPPSAAASRISSYPGRAPAWAATSRTVRSRTSGSVSSPLAMLEGPAGGRVLEAGHRAVAGVVPGRRHRNPEPDGVGVPDPAGWRAEPFARRGGAGQHGRTGRLRTDTREGWRRNARASRRWAGAAGFVPGPGPPRPPHRSVAVGWAGWRCPWGLVSGDSHRGTHAGGGHQQRHADQRRPADGASSGRRVRARSGGGEAGCGRVGGWIGQRDGRVLVVVDGGGLCDQARHRPVGQGRSVADGVGAAGRGRPEQPTGGLVVPEAGRAGRAAAARPAPA